MKGKFILPLIFASGILAITACSTIPTTNTQEEIVEEEDLDTEGFGLSKTKREYVINLTPTENVLIGRDTPKDTSKSYIKITGTTKQYTINHSKAEYIRTEWQRINRRGYFCNTNENEDNAFYGLKRLEFDFWTANVPFTIVFSRDGVFDGAGEWSRSFKTKKGGHVIECDGHPRFFKFQAENSFVDINSAKIVYSNAKYEDEEWDRVHGVNPIMFGSYYIYGLYPQNYVATSGDKDSELACALDEKVASLGGVRDGDYFWYDDEYYVRDTANPYYDDINIDGSNFFYDNTRIFKNKVYYFKCQPINWQFSADSKSKYFICTDILDAMAFDESSNVYANSNLRTWLNSEFFNKAFFFNCTNEVITKTYFFNNEGVLTGDNIYVGTKEEYSNRWAKNGIKINRKVTDYAKIHNVLFSCGYGYYDFYGSFWTRSVEEDNPYNVYAIGVSGKSYLNYYNDSGLGVVPTFTIKSNVVNL